MPISIADAEAHTSSADVDVVAHIEGVRLVRGSYTSDQICTSHRWKLELDQSDKLAWTKETFSSGAFFPRQRQGHCVITVSELKKMTHVTSTTAQHFKSGLLRAPPLKGTQLIAYHDKVLADDQLRLRGLDGLQDRVAAFESNAEDYSYLRTLGGEAVMAQIRKGKHGWQTCPFIKLMLDHETSQELHLYVAAVSVLMMNSEINRFDRVIYKAGKEDGSEWQSASALTRGLAINAAVEWVRVYNVHLQESGRDTVHWDNARYSFFVEGQYLRSLTKLSRRQEGRTGVSEKDLLERYGLK